MAKKKRKPVKMKCQDCKQANYFARRFKDPEKKPQLKKFCKWCRKHTLHKE